jgi:spore maturation protein CgeB
MDSLAWAFAQLGYDIQLFEMSAGISAEAFITELRQFSADVYITHNMYIFCNWGERGQAVESWIHSQSRPVAAWIWDSPLISGTMTLIQNYLFGPFPKNILHLCIDREWLRFLKDREIPCAYLPLAVDERFGNFISRTTWARSIDVSFVGKPFVDIDTKLSSHGDVQRFFKNKFLEELFAIINEKQNILGVSPADIRQSMAVLELPLSQFFSKNFSESHDYSHHRDLLMGYLRGKIPPPVYKCMLLMLGRLDMLFSWGQMTNYLKDLETFGLKAFGGIEWGNYYLKNQSEPTRRLTDLELLDCFAQSKISFCYSKWQFLNAIHERPFMVAGLGGFAITDYRDVVLEAFEADEMITYRSFEEAKDKIAFFLKNDAHRMRIAANGKSRVLKDHTYRVRVEQMMAQIRDWAGK